jgi:hypothetical protein
VDSAANNAIVPIETISSVKFMLSVPDQGRCGAVVADERLAIFCRVPGRVRTATMNEANPNVRSINAARFA